MLLAEGGGGGKKTNLGVDMPHPPHPTTAELKTGELRPAMIEFLFPIFVSDVSSVV
jgi:hypothetical protein